MDDQRGVSTAVLILASLLVAVTLLGGFYGALAFVDHRSDRHCWELDAKGRKTGFDHTQEGCGD